MGTMKMDLHVSLSVFQKLPFNSCKPVSPADARLTLRVPENNSSPVRLLVRLQEKNSAVCSGLFSNTVLTCLLIHTSKVCKTALWEVLQKDSGNTPPPPCIKPQGLPAPWPLPCSSTEHISFHGWSSHVTCSHDVR